MSAGDRIPSMFCRLVLAPGDVSFNPSAFIRMTSMKNIVAVFASAVFLSACGVPQKTDTHSTARVFKSFGTTQCSGGDVDLAAVLRGLKDTGIRVLDASCGVDGLARVAMCGAGDGRIAIAEIDAGDLRRAQDQGFALLSSVPEAKVVPCRQ